MMSKNKTEIESALRTLGILLNGLSELPKRLESDMAEPFSKAVEIFLAVKGRVIVTGVGKSGHIGNKIAATLASTGTPASFVHASEASHGDLGMVTSADAILALSWSGETAELRDMLNHAKRFSIPLVAITRDENSTLGKQADACLTLPRMEEACPNKLAPTTSTLLQLATGDALAVALLEARGFTASDFKTFHPGGSLGASLTRVGEIMHQGKKLPIVSPETPIDEAIEIITKKGFGCAIVVEKNGTLGGIITDGDLRRHFSVDLKEGCAADIMTREPVTIAPDYLASAALAILDQKPITSLVVCDNDEPVGLVHLHDLLKVGAA